MATSVIEAQQVAARAYQGDFDLVPSTQSYISLLTRTEGEHALLLSELPRLHPSMTLEGNGPHDLQSCYLLLDRNTLLLSKLTLDIAALGRDITNMVHTIGVDSERNLVFEGAYQTYHAYLSETAANLGVSTLVADPIAYSPAELTQASLTWSGFLCQLADPPLDAAGTPDYSNYPNFENIATTLPDYRAVYPLLGRSTSAFFFLGTALWRAMILHFLDVTVVRDKSFCHSGLFHSGLLAKNVSSCTRAFRAFRLLH